MSKKKRTRSREQIIETRRKSEARKKYKPQKTIEIRVMDEYQKKRLKFFMDLWREDCSSAPTPYHRCAIVSAVLTGIELEKQRKFVNFHQGLEYIEQASAANLPLMKKAYKLCPAAFKEFEL